jgi:hypothetical protein
MSAALLFRVGGSHMPSFEDAERNEPTKQIKMPVLINNVLRKAPITMIRI